MEIENNEIEIIREGVWDKIDEHLVNETFTEEEILIVYCPEDFKRLKQQIYNYPEKIKQFMKKIYQRQPSVLYLQQLLKTFEKSNTLEDFVYIKEQLISDMMGLIQNHNFESFQELKCLSTIYKLYIIDNIYYNELNPSTIASVSMKFLNYQLNSKYIINIMISINKLFKVQLPLLYNESSSLITVPLNNEASQFMLEEYESLFLQKSQNSIEQSYIILTQQLLQVKLIEMQNWMVYLKYETIPEELLKFKLVNEVYLHAEGDVFLLINAFLILKSVKSNLVIQYLIKCLYLKDFKNLSVAILLYFLQRNYIQPSTVNEQVKFSKLALNTFVDLNFVKELINTPNVPNELSLKIVNQSINKSQDCKIYGLWLKLLKKLLQSNASSINLYKQTIYHHFIQIVIKMEDFRSKILPILYEITDLFDPSIYQAVIAYGFKYLKRNNKGFSLALFKIIKKSGNYSFLNELDKDKKIKNDFLALIVLQASLINANFCYKVKDSQFKRLIYVLHMMRHQNYTENFDEYVIEVIKKFQPYHKNLTILFFRIVIHYFELIKHDFEIFSKIRDVLAQSQIRKFFTAPKKKEEESWNVNKIKVQDDGLQSIQQCFDNLSIGEVKEQKFKDVTSKRKVQLIMQEMTIPYDLERSFLEIQQLIKTLTFQDENIVFLLKIKRLVPKQDKLRIIL